MNQDNSRLFRTDDIDRINIRVEQEIDCRLFMFHAYNPSIPAVCTAEGKFFVAVKNLYSLYKDCGWVFEWLRKTRFREELNNRCKNNHQRLNSAIKTLSDIRTYLCHNQSPDSGNALCIGIAESWMRDHTVSKQAPSNDSDYQGLLDELRDYYDLIVDMGNFIVDIAVDIKNNSSAQDFENDLLKEWIDCIVKRFSTNNDYLYNTAKGLYYNSSNSLYFARIKSIVLSYYYNDIDEMFHDIHTRQNGISKAQEEWEKLNKAIIDKNELENYKRKYEQNLAVEIENCKELENILKRLRDERSAILDNLMIDGKPIRNKNKIVEEDIKDMIKSKDKADKLFDHFKKEYLAPLLEDQLRKSTEAVDAQSLFYRMLTETVTYEIDGSKVTYNRFLKPTSR